MNLFEPYQPPGEEEQVARSLALLADRVEHYQPVDRVAAVHRRYRRRVALQSSGAALAAVLVVGGVGLVSRTLPGGGGVQQGQVATTNTAAPTVPAPSAPSVPAPSGAASARALVLPGVRSAQEAAWLNGSYGVACAGDRTPTLLDFTDGVARPTSGDRTRRVELVVRDVTTATLPVDAAGRMTLLLFHCQDAAGRTLSDQLALVGGAPSEPHPGLEVVDARQRLRLVDAVADVGRLTLTLKGYSDPAGAAVDAAPDVAVVRAVTVDPRCGAKVFDVDCTADQTEFRYPLRTPDADPLDTAPFLSVALRETSSKGRTVMVDARAVGPLPLPLDAVSGRPLDPVAVATGVRALRTHQVDFGDGTAPETANPAGDTTCPAVAASGQAGQTGQAGQKGPALAEVLSSLPIEHTYAKPGTYTITFRTSACAPVGERTATLRITVP